MTTPHNPDRSEELMTPAAAPRRPRILCVGAYERDNFGDLLFQIITAQYLQDADVVFAAPFEVDMTDLIGLHVPAYGPLLENEDWDAVWTVGGEVGGTTIDYAYRTAHGDEAFRAFSEMSPDEKRALLATENGTVPMEAPYLPRISSYERNMLSATVLNSVGIAGVQSMNSIRKSGMIGQLHEATSITVRDKYASAFLEQEGIAHSLEPDLVHAISVTRPREDEDRGDYVLLQVSIAHLQKYGVAEFARAVIDSDVLREHPVRLFTAGTAPGHDSFELYEQIVELVHAVDPERRITISRTIDAWERVDEIARAKLWIGSSLHGRIISCAYGVPRVSFSKRKVDDYIRTWDADMPWGVDHLRMGSAAEHALTMVDDGRGAEYGIRAHENIQRVVEHVRQWAEQGAPSDRLEQIVRARNLQWSRLTLEIARGDARRKADSAAKAAAKAVQATSTPVNRGRRLIARALRKVARIVE